jgi:hypothetical protein
MLQHWNRRLFSTDHIGRSPPPAGRGQILTHITREENYEKENEKKRILKEKEEKGEVKEQLKLERLKKYRRGNTRPKTCMRGTRN